MTNKLTSFESKPFLVCIISIATAILGCTNSPALDRDTAKAMIEKSGFKSQEEMGVIYYGTIRSEQRQIEPCKVYTDQLVKLGMATVAMAETTRHAGIDGTVRVIEYNVEPTSALNKLLMVVEIYKTGASKAEVVAWKSKLGNVSGIAFTNPEKSSALVEYEVTFEGSPLSGINGCHASVPKPPSSKIQRAAFRLYDDGWRIVN